MNSYAGSVDRTPRPDLDDSRTNKGFAEFQADAENPAMTLQFTNESQWRRVSDPGRSL